MGKIVVHQEKIDNHEEMIELCPFDAIQVVERAVSGAAGEAKGHYAYKKELTINESCKVCKLCVKNGPEGVFEFIEEVVAAIDKSLWRGIAVYVDHEDGEIHPVTYELIGKAVPSVTDWQYLNLNYVEKAVIDQELCIKCGRCHVVCEDTSHQAITHRVNGERHFEVIDSQCVGCNLCVSVCPVDGCITMYQLTEGTDPRTGEPISDIKADWTTHPNNPMRKTE